MNNKVEKTEMPKPKDATAYKKAVTLGKSLSKKPENTKADIARQMFELINSEDKAVIANAFIEGAKLTPKGAMRHSAHIPVSVVTPGTTAVCSTKNFPHIYILMSYRIGI